MHRTQSVHVQDFLTQALISTEDEKVLTLLLEGGNHKLLARQDVNCRTKLMRLANSSNPRIALGAIIGLGATADPNAANFLVGCLRDSDPRKVRAAAGILGAIGLPQANSVIPALQNLLTTTKDPKIRQECRRSLRFITSRMRGDE